MARQNLNLGTTANDGSGDTLRIAGQKINQNFQELYNSLFGDSIAGNSTLVFGNNEIVFEGAVTDNFETTLTITNPTADRIATFPDATGDVILDVATQTLTNKTLTSPFLTSPGIKDGSGSFAYNITPSTLGGNIAVTLPLLTTNDTFAFANHTQTFTNKTLSAPMLNSPRISRTVTDSGGNVVFATATTASAINHITIGNAANGGHPGITAAGSNTNINLNLAAKGTGAISVRSRLNLQAETITSDGPASVLLPTTILSSSSTILVSLANGTTTGDIKKFVNINIGNAVVTPVSFNSGTSFTLKQNAAVEAMWVSNSWYLIGIDAANDITHNIFIS